jgi:homeobox protein cut-like
MRPTIRHGCSNTQIESENWDVGVAAQHLPALGAGGRAGAAATHALLQERNRALSSELSAARRAAQDARDAAAAAEARASAATADAATHAALIKRLEADLAAVRSAGTPARLASGLLAAASPMQLTAALPSGTSGGGDVLAVVPQSTNRTPGMESTPLEPGTPPSVSEGGGGDQGSNLLDILALQRDRFRQRAAQLEEETGALSLVLQPRYLHPLLMR